MCFSTEKISLHSEKANIISSTVLSGNISKGNFLLYFFEAFSLGNFMITPAYRHFRVLLQLLGNHQPLIGPRLILMVLRLVYMPLVEVFSVIIEARSWVVLLAT
jgi:hypothetical protein